MGIEIQNLKQSDKERLVFYDTFVEVEVGRITSWNEKWVFVRYFLVIQRTTNALKILKHCGETAAATNPADLEFCEEKSCNEK